jgi:hypothetical protein
MNDQAMLRKKKGNIVGSLETRRALPQKFITGIYRKSSF